MKCYYLKQALKHTILVRMKMRSTLSDVWMDAYAANIRCTGI